MSLVNGLNEEFERHAFRTGGFQIRYIPPFESDNDRLGMYQQLFRDHSPQPDICEIDIIWPTILADDLVDLRPYLGEEVKAFAPELIQAFTVKNKLVAIPVFMDTGLLYYRSDLLKKYGFRGPPKTWDELTKMAQMIQDRERRQGNKDFWGFVWQGGSSEGLTCDALEWQYSNGGGNILEPGGTIHVCNRRAIEALERAVSWVGSISPPGVVAYDEDDSLNVWRTGKAAFMRNWLYVYGAVRSTSCPMHDHFGVAMLPGGQAGQRRMLGGTAIAVSKYSRFREQSIAAIRYLTSEATEKLRTQEAGSVPTRWKLQQNPEAMGNTPFYDALTGQVMTGVITRPSLIAGKTYDQVSQAYFNAVHAALTRQKSPAEALAALEAQLVQITRLKPVRD